MLFKRQLRVAMNVAAQINKFAHAADEGVT
jgi:hypothetical protein